MVLPRRTPIRWAKFNKSPWRPVLVFTFVLFAVLHWKGHRPLTRSAIFFHRHHVRDTLPQRPPELSTSQDNQQHVLKPWRKTDETIVEVDENEDEDAQANVLDMDVYYAKHDGHPFDDFGDSRDVYYELYSMTRPDRKYYGLHMDGIGTFNANLLPHPTRIDMWIATASHVTAAYVESLSCNVGILNEVLVCAEAPVALPIVQAVEGSCAERLAIFNMYRGPRDIRVFWGPDTPYVTFGAPSRFGCLGQWVQDARELLEPYKIEAPTGSRLFHGPTELQRPKDFTLTRETIEKNFFVFWDLKGAAYVHYTIWPSRSFAKLDFDGSVGPDLAPEAKGDRLCLMENMPVFNTREWFDEKLHQATNSLSITLCKRADPGCQSTADNTYIMHIFHRRRYHRHHATYQPYVILFKQEAPFNLHSVSQRALWIHGRTMVSEKTGVADWAEHPDRIPTNHSEMFFVTSMSWKNHGQKYHGYLDDPLWLNFGREDVQAGSIDVMGESLVQDMSIYDTTLLDKGRRQHVQPAADQRRLQPLTAESKVRRDRLPSLAKQRMQNEARSQQLQHALTALRRQCSAPEMQLAELQNTQNSLQDEETACRATLVESVFETERTERDVVIRREELQHHLLGLHGLDIALESLVKGPPKFTIQTCPPSNPS